MTQHELLKNLLSEAITDWLKHPVEEGGGYNQVVSYLIRSGVRVDMDVQSEGDSE